MTDYLNYKWIKVERHKYDPNMSWEENYKALDQHHIEETSFLIDEVRKLSGKLKVARDMVEDLCVPWWGVLSPMRSCCLDANLCGPCKEKLKAHESQ